MDDSTQRHRVAANADLWAGLMAHVAPALLGEPNLRLSRPSAGELRYGNRGSLVVHVLPHQRAGRWHDFETGNGGGVIDLVAAKPAATRRRRTGCGSRFLPNSPASPVSRPSQPSSRRTKVDTDHLARRRADAQRIGRLRHNPLGRRTPGPPLGN